MASLLGCSIAAIKSDGTRPAAWLAAEQTKASCNS